MSTSKIKEKMKKVRERRKAAPLPITKPKEEKNESQFEQSDNDGFPSGLLVSIFLFLFFGAKYGIKRK